MSRFAVLTLGLVLILLNLTASYGALQVGFYKYKCGKNDVEKIIRGVVERRVKTDRSIVAALLRMQFHDCFVSGCDASLLLNGPASEKTAIPNLSVRGYDLIDQAKAEVENYCPGLVSCADIIAIATRDAVSFSGGNNYKVETGRRDGFVSLARNVDLPPPFISVRDSIAAFARKGLDKLDMVLLLGGGHTVGVTHCSLILNRLYNFRNSGKQDWTMEPSLAKALKQLCPQRLRVDNAINLDQTWNSSLVVDNGFYKQVKMRRGILEIDQGLGLDPSTSELVKALANGFNFQYRFGQAMIKMGAIEVLTGDKGEIRRTCSVVNPKTTPKPAPKPAPKPISNLIPSLIKH